MLYILQVGTLTLKCPWQHWWCCTHCRWELWPWSVLDSVDDVRTPGGNFDLEVSLTALLTHLAHRITSRLVHCWVWIILSVLLCIQRVILQNDQVRHFLRDFRPSTLWRCHSRLWHFIWNLQ